MNATEWTPFAYDQPVRLVRPVWDDEFGYEYPAGCIGKFEAVLEGGDNCIIWVDKSQSDPLDNGYTDLLCKLADLEPVFEAAGL